VMGLDKSEALISAPFVGHDDRRSIDVITNRGLQLFHVGVFNSVRPSTPAALNQRNNGNLLRAASLLGLRLSSYVSRPSGADIGLINLDSALEPPGQWLFRHGVSNTVRHVPSAPVASQAQLAL